MRQKELFPSLKVIKSSSSILKSSLVTARHKHKRGTDIVLVPQPSDDLNDPLNWPAWKRGLAFSTICIFTFLVSWALGGLGAALVQLSEDLNADLNLTVHVIVTWVVLTLGLAVIKLRTSKRPT